MLIITKLERNGSNFQHWEVYFKVYVAFAADIAGYLAEDMYPGSELYNSDFSEVFNSIIHWTIEGELARTLRDIPHPAGRLAKLQKQFSGVSFLVGQATMNTMTLLVYNPKAGSLDKHVMIMK